MERLSQVPSFEEIDFKLTDNYIPSSTNSKNNIPCSLEYTVSIVSIHELMTDSNYQIGDPQRLQTIQDHKAHHLKMSYGNYITAADSIMKEDVDKINEGGIKRIQSKCIAETNTSRPKIVKDLYMEQSDRQRVRFNSIGQESRKRICSLQHKATKNPNNFTRNRSNTLIPKKKDVQDKSMFAQFNSEATPIMKRVSSGKQKPRCSLQDKKGGFLEDKDFNIFSNAFTVKQIKLKSDQMREKAYLKKLIQNRATIIHISERNNVCNKNNIDLINQKLGKLIQNRF